MNLKSTLIIATLLISGSAQAMPRNWDDYSKREQEDVVLSTAYEQSRRSHYRMDCSGFVEAVLEKMGHDVPEFIRSYDIRANGVRQIYEYVARSGSIFKKKMPEPGDLIFFSKTYDMNRDQIFNDSLTHVGIVTAVDRDGTISFMHVLQKKVQTDFMNLSKPNVYEENGKILNSFLRRAQKNAPTPLLASQLFDFFGSLNPI